MRVVRTFHPIGQGAFYSERFYMEDQQGTVHNVVYDCGVAWGYKRKVEHVVTQAFTQTDIIDYLFISHLDYDHVSLVKKLIDSVSAVRNIVLPLVTEEQLDTALACHKAAGHNSVCYFLRCIINHLRGRGGEDFKGGEYTLHFVAGEEAVNQNVGRAGIWLNGTKKKASWEPEWVFKPYNVELRSRKQELIAKLATLLSTPDFNAALQRIGEGPLHDADELYEKLKDSAFVGKVLSDDDLRVSLKGVYEKISGGTNENSLILYSGPANVNSPYAITGFMFYRPWSRHFICQPGCLYTGDSNADMAEWKDHVFSDVWDCIRTIQLPHHGSVDSFNVATNPIDKPYIIPVSFGGYNTYGHPSGKVLAYLMTNRCSIQIVTEMANTMFAEEIEPL